MAALAASLPCGGAKLNGSKGLIAPSNDCGSHVELSCRKTALVFARVTQLHLLDKSTYTFRETAHLLAGDDEVVDYSEGTIFRRDLWATTPTPAMHHWKRFKSGAEPTTAFSDKSDIKPSVIRPTLKPLYAVWPI